MDDNKVPLARHIVRCALPPHSPSADGEDKGLEIPKSDLGYGFSIEEPQQSSFTSAYLRLPHSNGFRIISLHVKRFRFSRHLFEAD